MAPKGKIAVPLSNFEVDSDNAESTVVPTVASSIVKNKSAETLAKPNVVVTPPKDPNLDVENTFGLLKALLDHGYTVSGEATKDNLKFSFSSPRRSAHSGTEEPRRRHSKPSVVPHSKRGKETFLDHIARHF